MANHYEGYAVLVADGLEFDVAASLSTQGGSSGLRSWDGQVQAGREGAGWEVFNAGSATLRMPDGREGSIIVTYVDPISGAGSMLVQGSGAPPF